MRHILYFTLLLIFSSSLNGQIRNLRLGVGLEPVSLSYMNSDTPLITLLRSNVSSSIAFKTEYYFSPFVSFSSGVGFTVNQGATLVYENGGDVWAESELIPSDLHNIEEATRFKTSIRYLEFPFALKLRTDEIGKYRVFFEIPRMTLGVTTNATGTIRNDFVEATNQNIFPSMTWLNLSYGVMAGIEYSMTQNISGILGLNWKQGFIDVTEDVGVDSKITTGTFGVYAGILF